MRFAKPVAAVATVLWIATFAIYGWRTWTRVDYADFDVYYRASARMMRGGWHDLYSVFTVFADGKSPFRYSPATLLFFRPLAYLSAPAARLAHFVFEFGFFTFAFLAAGWVGSRLLPPGRRRGSAPFFAGASLLFSLRYVIDALWCGQVSGFISACYAGLFVCLTYRRRPWAGYLAGALIALPALFKIGPAILLFSLLPVRRARFFGRACVAFIATVFGLAWSPLLVGADLKSLPDLWAGWWSVVLADSEYFNALHYGSQSLKSVLARTLAVTGGFHMLDSWLEPIWLVVVALVSAAAFYRWSRIRRSSLAALADSTALAIGLTLILMPETFKYAMAGIALITVPVLVRLAKGHLLVLTTLGACAAFMALPGLDIVGSRAFFAIQTLNLPFVALLALCAQLVPRQREDWRDAPPLTIRSAIAAIDGSEGSSSS